jgi:ATP-dependent RNA helicase HelY
MLRPGDLVDLPGGDGLAIVISVAYRGKGSLRLRAITAAAEVHSVVPSDFDQPPYAVGFAEVPAPFSPAERWFIDECAALVRDARPNRAARRRTGRSASLRKVERELHAHPVHACPDREAHLASLGQLRTLERAVEDLRAAVARRQGSVVRRFEAVVDLMSKWDLVWEWSLTSSGRLLASVYHECDLVIAEGLVQGVFDGLHPDELAAVVSCLTYEERRKDGPRRPQLPAGPVPERFERLVGIAERLHRSERERALPLTRLPDPGFAHAVYHWSRGDSFESVLDEDLSAGDFVRNVKVLADLLRQFAVVAPDAGTRATAGLAADAVVRGVVAASSEIVDASADLAEGEGES